MFTEPDNTSWRPKDVYRTWNDIKKENRLFEMTLPIIIGRMNVFCIGGAVKGIPARANTTKWGWEHVIVGGCMYIFLSLGCNFCAHYCI